MSTGGLIFGLVIVLWVGLASLAAFVLEQIQTANQNFRELEQHCTRLYGRLIELLQRQAAIEQAVRELREAFDDEGEGWKNR